MMIPARVNPHWNEETRQFYQDHFGDDSQLEWGIYEPYALRGQWDGFEAVERKVGYRFPVLLDYVWNLESLNAGLENATKEGRTLELTLQPPLQSMEDGSNVVTNTLSGVNDDHLRQCAEAIAAYGKPVLLRLCNEMNGDWVQYNALHTGRDASLYVEFYRYVYRIFDECGARLEPE